LRSAGRRTWHQIHPKQASHVAPRRVREVPSDVGGFEKSEWTTLPLALRIVGPCIAGFRWRQTGLRFAPYFALQPTRTTHHRRNGGTEPLAVAGTHRIRLRTLRLARTSYLARWVWVGSSRECLPKNDPHQIAQIPRLSAVHAKERCRSGADAQRDTRSGRGSFRRISSPLARTMRDRVRTAV